MRDGVPRPQKCTHESYGFQYPPEFRHFNQSYHRGIDGFRTIGTIYMRLSASLGPLCHCFGVPLGACSIVLPTLLQPVLRNLHVPVTGVDRRWF